MVDAEDLKSFDAKTSCRFESDPGHQHYLFLATGLR